MRSSSWFGQALIVIVLVAAGAILWRTAESEQRLAAAERDLVTLRYQEAADLAQGPGRIARLLPGSDRLTASANALDTSAAYWQGDYDAVATNVDAKLMAANAAYRKLRQEGGTWQTVVGRLDNVVKSYAEILREQPDNAEAAFNYEYAARLRAVLTARKQPVAPFDATATLTLHGVEGAPPEASDMKKFKMIVPMRPDERLEAEKAGKGTTKVRKG
ncbi:MAG: hypothetical protein Q8N52_08825 [Acidobacteriota bacterium]|nr:hypothetical protein [Acidobacteriota bacterium]MDP3718013.1 hypothetical protein [Acidobacteriota bacterium]